MKAALSLLSLAVLAGCAHSNDLIADADADLRYHDYESALRGYRRVADKECGQGNAALCCRALLGQGESLLPLRERQTGVRVLERARSQCPQDLEVRRKLYLAEHADDPEGAPAGKVTFARKHVVSTLGERARIVWLGLFLDGEVVGREPLSVTAGNHELEAEAVIEVRGAAGGRRPVRLRARHPVVAPARAATGMLEGKLRLILGERADASLPEDRVIFQMEATALDTPGAAAPGIDPSKPVDTVLAQHLGLGLRVSGDPPRIPPELMRRGLGWKLRTEICIDPQGRVASVEFLGPSPAHDPRVDAAVLEALRRWRYGSYRVNGTLQGFCHPLAVDLGG